MTTVNLAESTPCLFNKFGRQILLCWCKVMVSENSKIYYNNCLIGIDLAALELLVMLSYVI